MLQATGPKQVYAAQAQSDHTSKASHKQHLSWDVYGHK